jgi:outer membrane protein assembly factor BamB
MPEFAPGDVFVEHRIEGLAGRGGMGVVYRATDIELERVVALKVITPALAEEEDFRRRFVAESKAAASIEHPNVIPVYYAGQREGVLYIVMRYIDGPDLRALVRAQGKLEPERAAHIVAQVGAALDAAHAHGLVHRDVKPANVLLGHDDHTYLTDFGLTKRAATTADGGPSRAGGWVGTLGFVAPEQIRGERVDARTDVYALGCVLVYALTGQAPYLRDSDEATLWAHLNAPPPSDTVPAEFEGVVARALAKDPSERFLSAGDLGRAALAAAGRSVATGPERNIARGDAAPPGMSATAATAPIAAPDAETHLSPAAGGATVATARDGGRGAALLRRPRVLAGGAAIVAAAVLAAVLLTSGGGDTSPTTPAPVKPPPRGTRASVAGPTIRVGTRPNGLTVAGGRIWALSGPSGEIDVINPRTKAVRPRIFIGSDGKSLVGGFNSVWVLKGKTRSLLRRNVRGGGQVGPVVQIAYAGLPIQVVAGQRALWVGVRTLGAVSGEETVVKIDPSTLTQERIPIPGGVKDIAVGEGALWVTNRFRNSVLRIDARTGAQRAIGLNGTPGGLAVGAGAAWIATTGKSTITRISPRGLDVKPIEVPSPPTRVTVGGGSVWATSQQASRLLRIDPADRKLVERIKTGSQPFALDVERGRTVWVTLLASGTVQPVRFSR